LRGLFACWAAIAASTATWPAAAQEPAEGATDTQVYAPEYFARFAPRSALDMLRQIPGFTIRSEDQGRGLGQASDNVVVNGERLASKSDDIFAQLSRITADRVVRIEIVEGAALGIPGLSGQVANVITEGGAVSGRFEYRATARPKYAEPGFWAGEVSVSGSTPRLEWTLAYTHNNGRGAAGGPGFVTDGGGSLTENRDIHLHFEGEFPKLTGTLKWDGPGSMVANFNANYSRNDTDFSNDEQRDPVTGTDLLRDFDNRNRGYGYEIGGDVDIALGPGRLKLIGLERFNHDRVRSDSIFVYADDRPSIGNRYAALTDSGERIGRAEYRWDMLGGNWQVDTEAAFNRLDQAARLFELEPDGEFAEIPFPAGSGGVTEDRYETILTHGRTLGKGLTMQLGIGGEYSKLAQTGPGGQVRTFWRPKGSFDLAWTPKAGLDMSFGLARSVGQLSFGDFLARVFLDQENENAGNAALVPQQSWEVDFEIKKTFGSFATSTLRAYAHWIEDYIDIVPLPGGVESRGNIVSARLYGLDWRTTFTLDAIGWKGAKLDTALTLEDSRLLDPVTSTERAFSAHADRRANVNLRHDIPGSDWAWGGGFDYNHVLPYYRLTEVGRDYEGPVYTYAFVEHKDVLGLTVNLQVFNVTDGRAIFRRTVYSGPRDSAPPLFVERRNLSVQPIFRLQVKGSF
jgi:hypothetical protein